MARYREARLTKFRIPKKEAIAPPDWDEGDAYAFQALARGEANEAQQKRALDWIIDGACCTYDVSFRPGKVDETTFAEGRRFVGLQIVKLLKVNPAILKKKDGE